VDNIDELKKLSDCATFLTSEDGVSEFKKMYEVVESEHEDYYAIRIKTGEFKDIIYKYDGVNIDESGDELTIKYGYNTLVGNDDFSVKIADSSDEFKVLVGKILNFVLYEYVDKYESVDELNGIDDTEELNT
jgi:hypothetical protein